MLLLSMLGDAFGGAYGVARGPRAIRRVLDTERKSVFAVVLLICLLTAGVALGVIVPLLSEDVVGDRAAAVVVLWCVGAFGIIVTSALRVACDAGLRWWWRGRRGGRLILTTAPSGTAATAAVRSQAALVTPLVTATLLTSYGVLMSLLAVDRLSVWWAVPFVVWTMWGASYLAPFLFGRLSSGGLYFTIAGLEHRFGTVTTSVTWESLRGVEHTTPFGVRGDPIVARSFPFDLAGDPTDRRRERGFVAIPCTYLALRADDIGALLDQYLEQPHLRSYLGTQPSVDWGIA